MLSGGGAVHESPCGRTAPPPESCSNRVRRSCPEAGGVWVGGAKPGQGGEGVLARTLRRRSGANRWGRRAAEGDESTRGSRGSEANPTRGCGEITREAGGTLRRIKSE